MKNGFNDSITRNIKENIGIYFVVTLFFTIGIAAGAFTVKALSYTQKQDLVSYLNKFFQILSKQNIENGSIFLESIKMNFETIFFIWLLSITIIGVPITLIITAFRGFIVGFTIAFLIDGLGWKGIFFSLVAVIPQNIIYIPCLLIISALSISFSLGVIRKKFKKGMMGNMKLGISSYTAALLIIFVIMSAGSLFEAYASPVLLKSISSYMTIQ